MHALMDGIGKRMRFEVDATDTGTSAIEAFALGHGVCQDFAHVFIAAARHLGIPARYASGYLLKLDDPASRPPGTPGPRCSSTTSAGSASTRQRHVSRPTPMCGWPIGLDYLGAAPIRGAVYGGSGERLTVRVAIQPDARASR